MARKSPKSRKSRKSPRRKSRQKQHTKKSRKIKKLKTQSRSFRYRMTMSDKITLETELPKSLNNDFYSRDDIVVLCLAFDGVTQPIIWRYWWDLCINKENLKFIVHSPSPYEKEIHNPEFCYYNRLNLPFRETEWCTPSIVMAYIDALKYIIEVLYQNRPPKMIYLVSGSHIPITPAEEIFKKPVKDYICIGGVRRYDQHEQWVGLTGKTASKLCVHMDENWFKQKIIEYPFSLSDDYDTCPDETYILMALYELEIYVSEDSDEARSHNCYSYQQRRCHDDASPIEWKSICEREDINWYHDELGYVSKAFSMNFFNWVLYIRFHTFANSLKVLFVRKISSNPYFFFEDCGKDTLSGVDLLNFLVNPAMYSKRTPTFIPCDPAYSEENRRSSELNTKKYLLRSIAGKHGYTTGAERSMLVEDASRFMKDLTEQFSDFNLGLLPSIAELETSFRS